jgi:hypothetical protein
VNYATSNGTATAGMCIPQGQDYLAASGTLNFAIGETSKTFTVMLCGDPYSESPAETIDLTLSSPTGGAIGAQDSATLLIYDAATEFTNPTPIFVNAGETGSTSINVGGYTGSALGVRVTLFGISAATADNMDFLLVGPNGGKYVVMADTGGSNALSNATLTFEDLAATSLPDSANISLGQNYKPTNCVPMVSQFVGAPAPPYSEPGCGPTLTNTLAGTFGGAVPNGAWTLYVRNDGGVDPLGATPALGGWGIQFLAPTAAPASLSGRVATASGEGIRGATVTISGGGSTGPRSVTTGTFGYYSFDDLEPGTTYLITVNARRYFFSVTSRVVTMTDNVVGVDFIADSR